MSFILWFYAFCCAKLDEQVCEVDYRSLAVVERATVYRKWPAVLVTEKCGNLQSLNYSGLHVGLK